MKIVHKFLRSRVARLALLLVVLGSTAGLLSPVNEAQSAICAFRPVIRSYYSDATYTNLVGQRGNDCTCNGVFWGITTSYVKSETLCCSVNQC